MNAIKKRCAGRCVRMLAVAMIAVLVAAALAACGKSNQSGGSKKEEVVIMNPLTGDTDYTEEAMARRPVAIVVENHPDARPQWGSDDPEYSPDIIVQGEVEGGITRMLWLYADYTKLPDVIGPIRSARPPFIKFSEWFDSIFIHWGYSHSQGEYTGADKVFKYDKVDHIDRMWYDNNVPLYDRKDRDHVVNTEHTGIIYGNKVPDAIKDMKFRTEKKDETTQLQFYKTVKPRDGESCGKVQVVYSESASGWMDTTWTYNEDDSMYHSSDLDNDLKRDNIIVMYCTTEYTTNNKATYCRYLYQKGGTAKIASQGTIMDCKWRVDENNNVFELYTEEVNEEGETEEKIVKLNPGKSWVGLISKNNKGEAKVTPLDGAGDTGDAGDSDEA